MSDERSRASVDRSLEGAEIGAVERKSALAHKASPGYHAYRVPNHLVPKRGTSNARLCAFLPLEYPIALGSNAAGQKRSCSPATVVAMGWEPMVMKRDFHTGTSDC